MTRKWPGESLRGLRETESHTKARKSAEFWLFSRCLKRKPDVFGQAFCGPSAAETHPHTLSRYHFVITYFTPLRTFIP